MSAKPGVAVLIMGIMLFAGGCRFGPQEMRGTKASDVDEKLSTFAYIEDGDLVTLIVDIKATRDRGGEEYIPLEIAIANKGLRRLTISRESFVLIDQDGNRYPLASPRELLQKYQKLDFDRQYAEIEGIAFNRFSTYTRYRSRFSPTRVMTPGGTNLVQDGVTLPRSGYLIDWLYFPIPAGGLENRKFDLFVSAPQLEDPVFVKFHVR